MLHLHQKCFEIGSPEQGPKAPEQKTQNTEQLLKDLQQEMEGQGGLFIDKLILSTVVGGKKALLSLGLLGNDPSNISLLLTGVSFLDDKINDILDKVAAKSPKAKRLITMLKSAEVGQDIKNLEEKEQDKTKGKKQGPDIYASEELKVKELFDHTLSAYPGAKEAIANMGYTTTDMLRFMRALVQRESTFNAHAKSPSGAYGLCQMIPYYYTKEFYPWASKDVKGLGFKVKASPRVEGSSEQSQFGVALYNLMYRIKAYSDESRIAAFKHARERYKTTFETRLGNKAISTIGPIKDIVYSATDKEIPFFLAAMDWNVGGGSVRNILTKGKFPAYKEAPLSYGAAMVAKLRGYSFKNSELVS